jgi:tetratricopeptide (TPR) repeat protein
LTASFHFDDYALLSDPAITAPEGWLRAWRLEQTRPLTYFTFWMNHALGGANPAGYHAVNLGVHLSAVVLLTAILRRLLEPRAALLAGLLFAIHPIQTEPVVYIYQRGTLLATLLCLAAWRSWLAERPRTAVVWFAAALLAKEECAAFPLFLALFELSSAGQIRGWKPLAAMVVLALAAGIRVMALAALLPGSGAGAGADVTWRDYLAAQGVVIWRYLRLLAIPYGFTIDPEIGIPSFAPAALAWGAILAAAALAARRFRELRCGFWFLGALILLLPSSSVFPASDLAADRRMYLPLVSLAPAFALTLRKLDTRLLAAAGAALLILTLLRVEVWRTEERLWREAVARSPGKVRPLLQLARVAADEEALELLERAKALAPGDPRVASERGKRLLAMGRPAEALSEFGRALALDPRSAAAYNNRGVALLALGQREAARADFERALDLDPCLPDAYWNLARLGLRRRPPDSCRFSHTNN